MHPVQDLFLEGFSYVLQIDMHFICTPMWTKFYSCEKWVLHSCSSAIITFEGDEALCQLARKGRCHDKEASPSEHQHRMKTHLAGDDARLEEVPVLARRGGNKR
jgi:hypothetical protein